ncbi:hypothetical protein DRQ36_07685 [bacterium]|nr:MAG: hypothetical protein DRQ36_07685 [bacterium]
MKERESMFRNPAIISYVVKKIHERDAGKQVGKTFIQKIMYFLTRNGITDFSYTLYHYGPFSGEAACELDLAHTAHMVSMEWRDEKGYFIEASDIDYNEYIEAPEQERIDKIVELFADKNAVDLSIIATAQYIKDNFGLTDDKLIDAVKSVKSQYPKERIEDLIKESITE